MDLSGTISDARLTFDELDIKTLTRGMLAMVLCIQYVHEEGSKCAAKPCKRRSSLVRGGAWRHVTSRDLSVPIHRVLHLHLHLNLIYLRRNRFAHGANDTHALPRDILPYTYLY